MNETQRNFLILGAIAVLGVIYSQVFATAAFSLSLLINVLFTIAIVALLINGYRTNQSTIAGMPTVPRLVLQISGIAMLVILVTGLPLPVPGFGWGGRNVIVYFGLIGLCGFGIFWGWSNRYRYR